MVTAKEFFLETEEGDTVVAVNDDGDAWDGDVSDMMEGENGEVCLFADKSLAWYFEMDDVLQMGPGTPQAVKAGIHTPVAEVTNQTKGITWSNE